MHRDEVLQKLESINRYRIRQVDTAERSRVRVTPEFITIRPGSGGALVPLNDNGVKSLQKFVGVPAALRSKLSEGTYSRMLTELLGRKERYNMLVADDQVVDFAEYQGTRTLPAERVLRTIERGTRGNADFHRVVVMTNYSAMIEVVSEQQEAVVRGDIVRAGASVTFSPINTVAPLVQSSVLRLVCTNGLTAATVLREFHGGGNGNIWDWMRDSVREAYGALASIVSRYREMREERIPANHRAAMLEALLRSAKITGPDAEAVRAQALESPPRNAYEMMNLVTWASSHVVRDPARILTARATAAEFAATTDHTEVCPLCRGRRN